MFETELQFFIDNQTDLVGTHPGGYLLIVGDRLVGAFSSALAAYEAGQADFEEGTFLIQPCLAGPAAYTIELNGGI
ncbi:MAG: hypothetical protein V1800_02590 [Candidatus Latescibacterota bacterium]